MAPPGLGRWSWYLLEGGKGHRTMILTAYARCRSKASKSFTYYHQQVTYIKAMGLKTNPKKMF